MALVIAKSTYGESLSFVLCHRSGGQEEVLYVASRVWHAPSETLFLGEVLGHLVLTDLR